MRGGEKERGEKTACESGQVDGTESGGLQLGGVVG